MTHQKFTLLSVAFSLFYIINTFIPSSSVAQMLDARSTAKIEVELKNYVVDVGKKTLEAKINSDKFKIPAKLYNLNTRIQKNTGKVEEAKQQLIDFKNADKFTKVQMRCSSELKIIKRLASRNNINLKPFLKARDKACDLVVKLAKLRKMYEDFQSIKKNGYVLIDKHVTSRISKKILTHRYRRTTQKWTKVAYKPGKGIQFTVHFKFSNNKKRQIVPLPAQKNQKSKRDICLPKLSRPSFCFNILETTPKKVTIKFWVRAAGRIKASPIKFDIPSNGVKLTVPAPFGYLDHLTQMKEGAKQKVLEKLIKQVAAMVGIDEDKIKKIRKLMGTEIEKSKIKEEAQKIFKAKMAEIAKRSKVAQKYSKQIKIASTLYNLEPKTLKVGSVRKTLSEYKISFQNMDTVTKIKTLCNAQLPSRLKGAMSTLGIPITQYADRKTQLCNTLKKFGKIKKMYNDWLQVSKDGLHLVNQFHHNKPRFKGKRRSVRFGIAVKYMANEKKMRYDASFQFSGDKKQTLVRTEKFKKTTRVQCKVINKRGEFCFKVVNIQGDTVTIVLWAKTRYRKRTKTTGTGQLKIKIPFNYMDQISQMKNSKNHDAVLKMQKQLQSLVVMDASIQETIIALARQLK